MLVVRPGTVQARRATSARSFPRDGRPTGALPFAMCATGWGAVPARRFCSLVRAPAILCLVLVAAGASGAGISGVPTVTDGDTCRVGSERIRLHGIDPSGRIACVSPVGRSSAPNATAVPEVLDRLRPARGHSEGRAAARAVERGLFVYASRRAGLRFCSERFRRLPHQRERRLGRYPHVAIVPVYRVAGTDMDAWMVSQGWLVRLAPCRRFSFHPRTGSVAAARARRCSSEDARCAVQARELSLFSL